MPRLRGLILSTLLTVGCVGGMLGIDAAKGQEIAPSFVPAASSDLQDYVQRADDSFRWEVRETLSVAGCDVRRLHLTSQTWHGIPWKHVMYLIKPRELDPKRTDAVMLIAGGRWHSVWPENGPDEVSLRSEAQLMAGVANQFGCVIAVLTQVPFQPMMGDRYEDEIIAATFAKYLQTQESDWPLLLPMVKSAVRGMDASQAAAKENGESTWSRSPLLGLQSEVGLRG